ncbi:MAG: polysaccharide deacetylase family protein [Candidatus Lindowbacteria bacterium]|nr:polysaccharide deacetylase family protein [Candidatus Lindowbacteria bacterium]
MCAATTAKATPGGVAYPDGVLPNAAMTGEIIEFSLSVENTGDATIEDVWVELSIHEPSGAKIENSHTDFIDPETQNIGLIYWESQGSALPPGAVVRYAANYCLSKSVTGWVYIPGNYRLKYRAWRGQPGSIGAEPLSEIYEEPLTIGPISAPNLSVPILMYHRVDDTAENEYWVLRDEFESQMKALVAYGYQAISTEDIFNYNYSGGALPPKPVVITFDDGYEDMYTHAYPVLLQESLFGEFYIVTGSTESSPLARRYSSFFKGIKGQWNPHLTWPEIIEMAQDGMLFGSHTRTHRDLTTLTDEELESELLGSQQDLYSQGGILATSFSYPYGAGDDDAKIHQLLARYGYLTAVSAWQGVSETRYAQPLDLKRVYVYGPHPAADPDSNGVSVDYDPAHPNDFFMRKLDSDFPLPDIVIESVEFLDDLGNPRANNLFDEGETATVRVLAHNNGEDANVILSLNLDIDSGLAPLIYESHQTSPSQDIHRYFPTTTGTPEVFEFQWQIPPGAESGVYDYSLEFRDDTYILGYALTGWVEDSFNVCANIHLLGPPKGSNLSARPTFSWNPGCNSSFVVDFSYDAAFATTVRTTPVLTTSSFPVSTTTWNKTPKNKRIYWRVRGADLSVSPVEIETSQETWWFVRY